MLGHGNGNAPAKVQGFHSPLLVYGHVKKRQYVVSTFIIQDMLA